MKRNRRNFSRYFGDESYRKLFLISCEGAVTEPQYFDILNKFNMSVTINCLYGKGKSAPNHVLGRMVKKKFSLRDGDETWLVVDKDRWSDDQINNLVQWVKQGHKNIFRGLAVSNPKFELWLLLHFEDGDGVITSGDCSNRLGRYLPGYTKNLDSGKLNLDMVNDAISRAKKIDTPPCIDWPKNTGTTVYRLVHNIIKSNNSKIGK